MQSAVRIGTGSIPKESSAIQEEKTMAAAPLGERVVNAIMGIFFVFVFYGFFRFLNNREKSKEGNILRRTLNRVKKLV